MNKRSWIRQLFTRPVTRAIRKPPHRARLGLGVEALEDRRLLSIVVNNATDVPVAGETDLRQAIAQANATAGANTITFDPTVFTTPQTINLTGGQLELSNTTGTETITGSAAGVTVNAGGASRVFQVDALVTASISGLTITGGKTAGNGGGVSNSGTLALTNCTVSGNSANYGGGLYNSGTLALTNCTVSGNSANYGGGLYDLGYNHFGTHLALTNCTVSGNSANRGGGGVYDFNGAETTTLGNTIVAGNTAQGSPDVSQAVISQGNNLIGALSVNSSSGWVSSDLTGTTARPLNASLATLSSYGGPTQTMALLPGSLAIGAGSVNLVPAGITTDQRGEPRFLNGKVDIGAFESQGFTVTPVAGSTPQTTAIGTTFANPLALIVTANNPIEPVNGAVISFVTHPAANGASAFLSASTAVIMGGQAAVTAAPDNADGSYEVVASVSGLSASFNLTNTGAIYASLVVNTTSDSLTPGAGLLSLREAVDFANDDRSGNTKITFNQAVFAHAQTINLIGGQLELSNATEKETITGPNAGVTVNAGGLSRVFQVDGSVAASISGMTITGGNSVGNGGGVDNLGTLTLTNCTVSGNSAGNRGGGVLNNSGSLALTNCTVSDNSASNVKINSGSNGGGGVFNYGTATLTNCTVSGNSASNGGGVQNYGSLTMTNCTISRNSASYRSGGGGGVRNGTNGTAKLTNCTLSGNSASYGGGLYNINHGTATLTNCTVSGNSASRGGGGVFNFLNDATTTLTNCTVNGNSELGGGVDPGGGGVQNLEATITLTNCTVSGNSSLNLGGGGVLNHEGTATLTNCTVSGNSSTSTGGNRNLGGGGVCNYNGSTITLTNCTVSGNSATGDGGGLLNKSNGPYTFFDTSTATLTNCTVSGNSALTGGGISNQGTLNVASSFIFNNQASSAGGGISTTGGSATITDSVILANQVNSPATALGGGIDCENSLLSLTNSAVIANQASGATAEGGGIYALDSTAVNLQNCLVIGNKAIGSVLGEGGGIYSDNSLLTLLASNVIGNKATTAYDNIFSGM